MTLEDTLRTAMREIADDVEVRPTELSSAEELLAERVRGHRPPRRGAWLAAAAAAVLVAGVPAASYLLAPEEGAPTAPAGTPAPEPTDGPTTDDSGATPTVPVTPESLAGVWLTYDSIGWLWEFGPEGTVTIRNPDGAVGEDVTPHEFTVVPAHWDGIAVLRMPPSQCDLAVEITENGILRGTVLRTGEEDPDLAVGERCSLRSGASLGMIRLSPVSRFAAGLEWDPDGRSTVEPQPVSEPSTLARVWLQEGTGRVIELTRAPDGEDLTYRLADAGGLLLGAADEGTARLEGDTLVLVSDGTGCPAGALTVLSQPRTWGVGRPPPGPLAGLEVAVSGSPGCAAHADLTGMWLAVS